MDTFYAGAILAALFVGSCFRDSVPLCFFDGRYRLFASWTDRA